MSRGQLAIVNESTRLTIDQALAMVDAVRAQFFKAFRPKWGLGFDTFPALFPRVEDTGNLPLIVLLDSHEPWAGAHWVDAAGRVSGVVVVGALLDAGYTLSTGPQSISAVLSHECMEAALDPFCDLWVDLPDGGQDAFEVCDRVQGDAYPENGLFVSNFLLPAAFSRQAQPGPWDLQHALQTQWGVALGGYASRRRTDGTVYQINARDEARAHPWSRTARRLRAA